MSPTGNDRESVRWWWQLLAVLSFALWSVTALASDFVIMRQGEVGEDRAFLEAWLEPIRAGCIDCEPCGCDRLSVDELYIGRYDINGDGQPELFVVIGSSYFCGTAGCENPIFQKRNGHWVELTGLDGGGWIGSDETGGSNCHFIEVPGERRHGWLTLIGLETGLRWRRDRRTGRIEEIAFCLTRQCRHETGDPLETRWTKWMTSREAVVARVGPLCAKAGVTAPPR